jgi:hypothetical protein
MGWTPKNYPLLHREQDVNKQMKIYATIQHTFANGGRGNVTCGW